MKKSLITKTFLVAALAFSIGAANDSTKTTSAAPAMKSAPAAVKSKIKTHSFSGTVTAVDSVASSISGTNKNGAQTFAVAADAKIQEGKTVLTLGSIAVNSKIVVTFTEDAGIKNASMIKVQAESKKPAKAVKDTKAVK